MSLRTKIRPSGPVAVQRRQMVKELLADLRGLDRKRKEANTRLDQVLDDYGCQTLTGFRDTQRRPETDREIRP